MNLFFLPIILKFMYFESDKLEFKKIKSFGVCIIALFTLLDRLINYLFND